MKSRSRRKNPNKNRVRHSIFVFLILLLAYQIPGGVNALELTDKWRQLAPQEFESFSEILTPYDINS
jgi:hypothetical protein